MTTVNPCPFCGSDGENLAVDELSPGEYAIYCLNCLAFGPREASEEEALAAWCIRF